MPPPDGATRRVPRQDYYPLKPAPRTDGLGVRRAPAAPRMEVSVTLDTLPDDALQEIFAACSTADGVALLDQVIGLACLSRGMQRQLHRLRLLVGVQCIAVVQRSTWPCHAAFHPWRVVLLYKAHCSRPVSPSDLDAMFVLARQGRVHSIDASCREYTGLQTSTQAHEIRALFRRRLHRVVPDLLCAGRSLLELDLSFMPKLKGTWDSTFGGAAVGSTALRKLRVTGGPGSSGLRGPLPELRLPALQELDLGQNQFTGGLEPLKFCTGLQTLNCNGNRLTGGLAPLRNCIGLRELNVSGNRLTGGLDALQGCTALKKLRLYCNHLTGTLEPLRRCTALETLLLDYNQLAPTAEDVARFRRIYLFSCIYLAIPHYQ